ncbi:MAG: cytochrome C oxidase subunit IV family protein [Flavobacteriia bacterium]|nr:cytochrome C oxidase subunit IV family protein [Flavobacteriia bacterium]
MSDNHAHGGVRRLIIVFFILLVVTAVEVGLGIVKPAFLMGEVFGFTSWLNIIFIVLTLFKAYFIVEAFMHLEGEKKSLRLTIYLPILILIPYLTFILLTEGSYLYGA